LLKYTIGEYPYPLTKLPSEGNSSPWRIHASKLTLHPTPVTLEEIGLIYRSLANRTLMLSPKSLKSANSCLIHMSMKKYDPKTRLTVTVNGRILKKAKEEAKKRRIPISRLIENFCDSLQNLKSTVLNVVKNLVQRKPNSVQNADG